MLQKLALAVKSKTIELFAEEDEDDEDRENGFHFTPGLDSPEEIITGQRVVVLKPDNLVNGDSKLSIRKNFEQISHGLISSLFAATSSFHAAYLNFQIAHEPFQPDAIAAADRAAVLYLQRLSDLRQAYLHLHRNPNHASRTLILSSQAESQVQENQSMLRKFEAVFNRLQSDIDRKDEEVSALKDRLKEIEACNSAVEKKLKLGSTPPEKIVLSIGALDTVLQEAYKAAQAFTKIFIKLLKASGGDIKTATLSIYENLGFLNADHHDYPLLSHFCLGMFEGFLCNNSHGCKTQFLKEFIKHCGVDPPEILAAEPEGNFAKFSQEKFQNLIKPSIQLFLSSSSTMDESLRSLRPSNPLYEPFLRMSSSVWAACRLVKSSERPIEIFRVQPGANFSMVFMESVLGKNTISRMSSGSAIAKVGFTVFPGFQYGQESTIQCKVYLNYGESSS